MDRSVNRPRRSSALQKILLEMGDSRIQQRRRRKNRAGVGRRRQKQSAGGAGPTKADEPPRHRSNPIPHHKPSNHKDTKAQSCGAQPRFGRSYGWFDPTSVPLCRWSNLRGLKDWTFARPRQLNHRGTEATEPTSEPPPALRALALLRASNVWEAPLAYARSHGIVSWIPGFRLKLLRPFALCVKPVCGPGLGSIFVPFCGQQLWGFVWVLWTQNLFLR